MILYWYSGSDATGWVPTDRLGGGSLTLATAVAISGAAINPDGGHFDNTALYEMIRRRIKTIVVCEAGQDQKYEMADIANAIERVRADFGVHIQFNVEQWSLTHIRPDKKTRLAVRGFGSALRRGAVGGVPGAGAQNHASGSGPVEI
jgi:hypothetical protein